MGLWGFGKKALNSTIGPNVMPLDTMLSAKLACRGTAGTSFTIKHTGEMYKDITVSVNENSPTDSQGLYCVIVPLPVGTYNVAIDVSGTKISTTVNINTIGVTYPLSYASYTEIGRFTSNGTFTVPSGVTEIFVTGIGGGGGGGYGGGPDPNNGGGGGGGGKGSSIVKQKYSVSSGQSIAITVGAGGDKGASGSPTIVGNLVSLAGGTKGSDGQSGSSGSGGGTGGSSGGGKGGSGGTGGKATGGLAGSSGAHGGGAGGVGKGGGGGGGGAGGLDGYGGGKGGDGGDGERYTSAGTGGNGTNYGAGGGGGGGAGYRYQNIGYGGKGSDGVVIIYRGIVVN